MADEPNQEIIAKGPSLIGDFELKLPGIDYSLFQKLVGIFAQSKSCLASHKQEVHPFLENKYWLSTGSYS